MSLPKGYSTSQEYFHHANQFLKQYSWIYREANTEFLRAGVLDEMPQEYKDYFLRIETTELNQFPYVPETLTNLTFQTLNDFRQNLNILIPPEAFNEPNDVKKPMKLGNLKKMNVKKQHEIQRLAALVKECLDKHDAEAAESQQKCVLIDVGSGLGYLSELLYKVNENVLILGLEADSYRVQAAEKRIKSYMPNAINSIKYRQQFVTENSKDFIIKTIEEVFKLDYQHVPQQTTTKMVIIGLHACGDLTITSMKLFLQLPHVQQLMIMPCCYHKLQVCNADVAATQASTTNSKFRNFPMSESLKQVLLENNKKDQQIDNDNDQVIKESFTSYLNRPFLRLACQQTLKRWRKCSASQHRAHGSEMFFRAVVQLLLDKEKENEGAMEFVIVKRKEKIDLNSLDDEQLESFETFSRLYVLKRKSTQQIVDWKEEHREKFDKIIEKYPKGGKMAEGLTCLQTSMQKLCENLVLYDRLCFMEEAALKINLKIKARYEKIMDEELSPRCYVLIADKL